MKLVHLKDNIVSNISVVYDGYIAGENEVVIDDDFPVGPGYTYEPASDGKDAAWISPQIKTLKVTLPNHITQYAFFTRLGDNTVADIDLMSLDTPTADPITRKTQAILRARMSRLRSAQYIDLDLQELRDGFSSILAPDKFTAVFDNPIQDSER